MKLSRGSYGCDRTEKSFLHQRPTGAVHRLNTVCLLTPRGTASFPFFHHLFAIDTVSMVSMVMRSHFVSAEFDADALGAMWASTSIILLMNYDSWTKSSQCFLRLG